MPIFVTILGLISAAFLGYFATTGPSTLLVLIGGGIMVSVFAFLYPKSSLTLLVFSMLLSPKLGFGNVASRETVLRYDDILLVIIFFSWFARMAILKSKPFITATPLQGPILLYTSVYILSTGVGLMRGNLEMKNAAFFLLKYIEYFLLYFMTVNVVETKEQMRRYLVYGWIVALIVTVYAFYYYANTTFDPRTTAPFEASIGSTIRTSEPASLGGYYLVIFGAIIGLITEYSGYVFVAAIASMIFMFPSFLLTFSRSSYIGCAVLVATLIYFSNKRKLFIFLSLGVGLFVVGLFPGMANKVMNRITMTYSGDAAVNSYQVGAVGDVKLEDSAAARVNTLKATVLERLPRHPILGLGVTGIGLGDTQYALVLGETGLLGMVMFIWVIVTAFKTGRTVYYAYSEPWIKAISLGFISTIPALLAQSVGVNTFIIIRIMEPFWFMAAILSVLYKDIGAVRSDTTKTGSGEIASGDKWS